MKFTAVECPFMGNGRAFREVFSVWILFLILIFLFLWFIMFGDLFASFVGLSRIHLAVPCAVRDIASYFKNREWRKCRESGIVLVGGLFGTGKTLSIVSYAVSLKRKYDNVDIVSNVHINGIDYTPFRYFEQLSDPTPDGRIQVFVCDEFGSLFNSRNYAKTAITEAEYLSVLNQVRKDRKLLLISTQRYGMLDKVFRQVAKEWHECKRFWRFCWHYVYDPYDLEYTNDPRLVKPLSLFPRMIFATDDVYNLYDTFEIVKPFDNPVELTARSDTGSAVNADYRYSPKGRRKYYRR